MKRMIALAGLAALAGCSFVPRRPAVAPPVPSSWPVGDAYLTQREAALPHVDYRDIFRDARLQRLIDTALANNRDLRIAAANIAAARAQFRIQRAQELPAIASSNSISITDPGTGRTNNNGAPVIGGQRTSYTLNLGVTNFEIDLFGRIRALTEAAQNRYFATEAGARATRLALIGDIATAWLNYAADKSLLAIAQDTAASAANSVRLTQARLRGGVAPATDLAQAETILATAQSSVAEQRTLLAQDVDALQLLIGAPVDPALLPQSIEQADATLAELPAGLDSSVLLRRPDVVQAEYQMIANNAEIGAARAALFPRITLTGAAGLASNGLSRLFTDNAFNYSVAPGIGYTLFNAGAGRGNVRLARANFDAALASYERTLQLAFREVSDALARRGTIGEQTRAQSALVAAAASNFRLTEARYRGGIASFLESLDAQRSLFSARRTAVQTGLARGTNLVDLYRTLGGDSLLDRPAVARAHSQP